jgi:S-adenosylmethionine:tRNA ribosyltransferase-isomerase
MLLSDFDYHLPPELIAHYPLPERSASRLLCLDRHEKQLSHRSFNQLKDHLNPGDLLVFNNTRVMNARLFGHKETGGQVELLIEKILSPQRALAHIRASKAPKPGSKIFLTQELFVEVIKKTDSVYEVLFHSEKEITVILQDLGHVPLPPYITREDEAFDQERYQTIYAQHLGSVAAPTAGLHFDRPLLQELENLGIEFSEVTLHVGAGTFQPVRTEEILQHKMHAEYLEVSAKVCEKIQATRQKGKRVIAVGTTTVRSLETAALQGELQPYSGESSIFIYPGFQFRVIDGMVTNFHLPKSTLLMLVSAFAGVERIKIAYQEAISNHYRFYSYGDAMLII